MKPFRISNTHFKIHNSNYDVIELQKLCLDHWIFKNLELGTLVNVTRDLGTTPTLVYNTQLSKILE